MLQMIKSQIRHFNGSTNILIWLFLFPVQQPVFDFRLSVRGSSSSAFDHQSDSVYANVHMLESSPLAVTNAQDLTSASQSNLNHNHDVNILFQNIRYMLYIYSHKLQMSADFDWIPSFVSGLHFSCRWSSLFNSDH